MYQVQDAGKKVTRALPASATNVTSSAIDLENGTNGHMTGDVEVKVNAPACTTGQLADTHTLVYDLVHSVNSDLSSPATLIAAIITQTGAGGAGAAAAEYRCRVPSNVRRYLGLKCTRTGSGDASAVSATMKLVF